MARAILLDSGPLGRVTHSRAEQNEEVREWLTTLASAGVTVMLPEIVDYEHRRKMLRIGSMSSVRYLDELKGNITYAPLTTEVMLRAARLWADARKQGLPTAPEERLDVDVYPSLRRPSSRLKRETRWSWLPATPATSPGSWTPAVGER